MSSDAPKPDPSTTTTPPTTTPTPTPTQEPREVTIFITNKQWECRIQEGSPHLENGFVKAIRGDDNPHHWGSKKFQVYDAAGPDLVEVNCGTPNVRFWASFKNETQKLSEYWVCRKNGQRPQWWVFAPNDQDRSVHRRGGDFWGWEVIQKFFARSKVDSWVCENCTFLNTRVEDECEVCKATPPAERKSTPIKRLQLPAARPPVMTRSNSVDSDNGHTSLKYGWWICSQCAGENPPSMTMCDFCGKEDYNPKIKPEHEDLSKKVYLKGQSESFGIPVGPLGGSR